MKSRSRPHTLLGVWAHPDDEAYLSAGLMAEARRRGHRVVVVTATAGDLGTNDPQRWPPERLAELRRHEMRASLAALEVDEHRFLGLPDGGCPQFDATDDVVEMIREVQPDTIVTFGPDGMTGHDDHRAVSAWTTAAWQATGGHARLWYATVTPDFHRAWGHLNDDVGLWAYGEPPCVEQRHLAYQLDLEGARLDQKLAALRAHSSQTAPLISLVGEERYRDWWRTESFVDAVVLARLGRGRIPEDAEKTLIGRAA